MLNFVMCIIAVIVIIAVVSFVVRWKKINVWPEGFDDEEEETVPRFEFPKINRNRWGEWFNEE